MGPCGQVAMVSAPSCCGMIGSDLSLTIKVGKVALSITLARLLGLYSSTATSPVLSGWLNGMLLSFLGPILNEILIKGFIVLAG